MTAIALAGTAATASVQAALPELRVSENGRYLVREDGSPFFYLGDTAWELCARPTREEAEIYLKDRAAKGFTVIQTVATGIFRGPSTPNALGAAGPYIGMDPTRPNEEWFTQVDWITQRTEALGMYTALFPTWGDKVNKAWAGGPEIFTPANARAYGEFLGRRYKDAAVIWVLGGDRPVDNDRHHQTWTAMAEGIKAGDGGRHLITYHSTITSADPFHNDPWLSFNMIQSGHSKIDLANYDMIAKDYARNPAKPVLDGEPRYEDHPVNWKPELGYFGDFDVRKAAYWALFAGACGHAYGCNDVWQFYEPGKHEPITGARTPWKEALNLPGASQVGYARRLIESRPMLVRVPDSSLIAGGQGDGRAHVQATRASDGSYAFVYVPSGKPVTVDLAKLSGETLVAWWFDPRQGTAKEVGRFARQGQREFAPPPGGPDWVLVLDDAARAFGVPGGK